MVSYGHFFNVTDGAEACQACFEGLTFVDFKVIGNQ